MVLTPKQPIQIRLNGAELARLDAYRSTVGRFAPTRPTVVKEALMDWLEVQEERQREERERATLPVPPDATMEGGAEPVSVPPFDATRFALQPLCARGHDYQGTGKSLYSIEQRACVECTKVRQKKPKEATG